MGKSNLEQLKTWRRYLKPISAKLNAAINKIHIILL